MTKQSRVFDKNNLADREDVWGNNAAVSCPCCGKVYVVSQFLNKGTRHCPKCHKSSLHYAKGQITLEWEEN